MRAFLGLVLFIAVGQIFWQDGEPPHWAGRIRASILLAAAGAGVGWTLTRLRQCGRWEPPLPWWLCPIDALESVLIYTFLLTFFAGLFLFSRVWPGDLNDVELPTSHIQAVLHPDGRIITYSEVRHRVQEYDRDGWFLTGWNVNCHDRGVLALTEDGKVELGTIEERLIFGADRKVEVVTKYRYWRPDTSDMPGRAEAQTIDAASGVRIDVRWFCLVQRVVRIDPDGSERTVIWTPWYLWPLAFPAYPFLLIILALLLDRAIGYLARSRYIIEGTANNLGAPDAADTTRDRTG